MVVTIAQTHPVQRAALSFKKKNAVAMKRLVTTRIAQCQVTRWDEAMNTKTQLPQIVEDLIAQQKAIIETEQKLKAEAKHELEQKNIEAGRQVLQQKLEAILITLPEWLRPYDVTKADWKDSDLENLGINQRIIDNLLLNFNVPGLAPIQYKHSEKQWRSAEAYSEWNGDDRFPALKLNNSSYWRNSFEYTLLIARDNLLEYEKMKAEHDKETQRRVEQRKAEILREEQQQIQYEEKREVEKEEDKQLFEVFKDDPVVIYLLKAFLAIKQERDMFSSQIQDAEETIYSIEERWSRKASDLRRQADDAQRRADDERRRLEDDLSDAESKVNKLQKQERGW
jgi:hypothetical protein